MKFNFEMPSLTVAANSIEEALAVVASHISTVGRHVGSGHPFAECGARFVVVKTDDGAEHDSLADPIVAKHGPTALNLDPESDRGKAHAEQLKREAADRKIAEEHKAKGLRTDAENLALHSADEQAKLNAPK